jgi:Ca2+-binding RTX toxin-like protein
VFSSANGNPITVADADDQDGDETVTLAVDHGALTLGALPAGLTIDAGANGTATLTFTGTEAELNAALAGLTYAPTANYNGPDRLTVTINDNGHSGSGAPVPLSATRLIPIVVTAVNDAPTGLTAGTLDANEFATNGAPVGTVTATDPDSTSFVYSLADDAGGRFDINPATGAVTVQNGLLLDFEQQSSWNITVHVEDDLGAAIAADQQFAVTVKNVDPEFIIGDGTANHFVGGGQNDSLYGLADSDTLVGGLGKDLLDGGADADLMQGGPGDDTYVVETGPSIVNTINEPGVSAALPPGSGDQVEEDPDAGTDMVFASITYTLPANVENLVLSGTGMIGTGNGDNNLFYNTGGVNTFAGLGGNDTYVVTHTDDEVQEDPDAGQDVVYSSASSFWLPSNVEVLVVQGTGLSGYSFSLLGDSVLVAQGVGNTVLSFDSLPGSGANDVLHSLGGPNTLVGGNGNDTYVVTHTGDGVQEDSDAGQDVVYSSASFTIPANVEALVLTGTGTTATGNGDSNTFYNTGGVNTFVGGAGNDVYVVAHTGDIITELSGEGFDQVYSPVSFTLSANVEQLALTGTGLTGTGTGQGDILVNLGGVNTLSGGGGDDVYYINNFADQVTESAGGGNDGVVSSLAGTTVLASEAENLFLTGAATNGTGNSGGNWLIGNGQANQLDGRAGLDVLIGNGGNDTFVFRLGEAAGDVVLDFAGNGAAAGDSFLFLGFGTLAQGASFQQVDATHWQINSSNGLAHEVITLQNSASVNPSDFLFA